MKSCILITSHLNNSSKEEKAIEQLKFFQNKGLPIVYVGNYPISTKIQELSDFTLNTKENPIVNRFIIYYTSVAEHIGLGKRKKASNYNPDYGYAHLLQAYRGFKLAESLGYDHVMHFNYDMTISEEHFELLKNKITESPNLIFSWGKDHAYATNIYMMKVKDYIKICDEKLHYYVEGNPPGIHKKDWYCEAYFKYMIDQGNIEWTLNNNNEIKVSQSHHHDGVYLKNNHVNPFYSKEMDTILLNSHYHLSTPEIIYFKTEDGTVLEAHKKDSKNYTCHLQGKEGLLFDEEGGLFFKVDQDFKNRCVVTDWN